MYLHLNTAVGVLTILHPSDEVNVCDGEWHHVQFAKLSVGLAMTLTVDMLPKVTASLPVSQAKVPVDWFSFIYIGGIREGTLASEFIDINNVTTDEIGIQLINVLKHYKI